jgi:hypothetical protein
MLPIIAVVISSKGLLWSLVAKTTSSMKGVMVEEIPLGVNSS